ncbi:hypothetical protein BG53_01270 [Paenibacillus darwinianus]|uniref:Spore coat protein n=1 Tax=Paenibacillus darwinianus TaxID=1380763 RepID=A0A9W5S152_9BACL|nr:hypothetical protein [Paenibacillus darwinianus]EXX85913.1 hypothetical protein BG52_07415 [Paenibacillus darwinianus]EXX88168.1 hypothetical protein CH50_03850 [Paenibacillus darwinianus]EXX88766.1 hypothetical protein BG53_01270 [Paenibacillus darwinianus]
MAFLFELFGGGMNQYHGNGMNHYQGSGHQVQGGSLEEFVGKTVKINRGGPDSIVGRVLGVRSDYLAVSTREGIVYINTSHIKSITEGPKSDGKSDGRSRGRSGWSTRFIIAENFNGVLRRLNQRFVKINWGGPEKVEGFIVEVSGNTLLLVHQKEIIRIPLFHIKTVSPQKAGDHSDGNKNDGNKNKHENKSGKSGNKSGGRTVGGNTGGGRTGGR